MRKYILGEPFFGATLAKKYYAPVGQQAALCAEVLGEEPERIHGISMRSQRQWVEENFRLEYLAILHCLTRRMGQQMHVACAHLDELDNQVVMLAKELGCRLVGYPRETPACCTLFPRDYGTVLPDGTLLLNPSHTQELRGEAATGGRIRLAHIGEGGRLLQAGKFAVFSERQTGNGRNWRVTQEEVALITAGGLIPVMLPNMRSTEVGPDRVLPDTYSGDHVDRFCNLITGRDCREHLIIDPTVDLTVYIENGPRTLLQGSDGLNAVKRACEPYGIVVHQAPAMEIPYSLNFQQFEDRRIIMTGGEPKLQALLETLVGKGQVYPTEIPIRYYPAYRFGGIRCMIGDLPEAIFKR